MFRELCLSCCILLIRASRDDSGVRRFRSVKFVVKATHVVQIQYNVNKGFMEYSTIRVKEGLTLTFGIRTLRPCTRVLMQITMISDE